MQGIGCRHIDASPQCGSEVCSETCKVEEAPSTFEFDQEVYVTARPRVTAGHRSKQTRMNDPMPTHWRRHFPSDLLDGWTHRLKSTSAPLDRPLRQNKHISVDKTTWKGTALTSIGPAMWVLPL